MGAMELEDYFDFDHADGIRIRGTRINIEDVILAGQQGSSAAAIVRNYPSLKLVQVNAVLDYYAANRSSIDEYIAEQDAALGEARRRQETMEVSEVVQRIPKLRRAKHRESIS